MKRYSIVFIVLLGCFFSCAEKKTEKLDYYFDTKSFFQQEAIRLKQLNPIINKQVLLNEKTESTKGFIADWQNELLTFYEVDINKAAFVGKYLVDTIFVNNKISTVSCKAKDAVLKTRFISIHFDTLQQQPQKIELELATKNTLYSSTQVLVYEKNKFYSVKGTQKIKFLSPDKFEVKGVFNQ